MTHPTDDELEAMAVRLDKGDPFGGVMQQAAALLRACMGGAVKVKPLEWKECNSGNFKKGQCFAARSMVDFAPIAIHKKADGWWLSLDCETHPTLEAAKAAAQADYERRILSALEPAPDARQEAWRAGMLEAAKVAQGQYRERSMLDPESPCYGIDMTPDRSDWGRGIQRGREQAAAAIRALAEKGPSDD